MPNIQNFAAADLSRKTGDVLDAASRAPVAITKHRKPRFVVMSLEHFERMQGGSDQKVHTLEDMPADLKADLIASLELELAGSDKPND